MSSYEIDLPLFIEIELANLKKFHSIAFCSVGYNCCKKYGVRFFCQSVLARLTKCL